jgi:hypothetical protein
MTLSRVLKRKWNFETIADGDICAETLSGSAAQHFEVSRGGVLSFYRADSIAPKRIAFAIAIGARVIDEVEYCLIDPAALERFGLAVVDSIGKTLLNDVNHAHVDVANVTMAHLSGIAVACAREGELGVLASSDVISELVRLLEEGELQAKDLHPELMSALEKTRVYKRIQRNRARAAPS